MTIPAHQELCRLIAACAAYRAAVLDGWPADDLMQDVLLRVVELERAGHGWDPARGRLGVYVWIVTRGVVANARRDAGRMKRGPGVEHVEHTACVPGSVGGVDEAMRSAAIEHGLDDLETRTLRDVAGGTVRRTTYRARRVLRKVRP